MGGVGREESDTPGGGRLNCLAVKLCFLSFFSFLCWDTPVPKNCAQRTVEVGGLGFYEFLYVCVALVDIPWG